MRPLCVLSLLIIDNAPQVPNISELSDSSSITVVNSEDIDRISYPSTDEAKLDFIDELSANDLHAMVDDYAQVGTNVYPLKILSPFMVLQLSSLDASNGG